MTPFYYAEEIADSPEYPRILEWTTTPPTKPGHYRVVNIRGEAFWMDVIDHNGVMSFESEVNEGELKPLPQDWYTHWLGPIPVPEPPEK